MAINWEELDPTLVFEIGQLEQSATIRLRKDIVFGLDKLLADDYFGVFDKDGNKVNWSKQELLDWIQTEY